jgi:serine/threonine-protein kinase HipA
MADVVALAEVRIWGRTVGAAVELDDGRVVFEYDTAFRGSSLEVSPIHLPLTLGGPVGFPELARKSAFGGLPGVLADSLPDSFGSRVIRAYFTARGEQERAFSPVQRLLYVGERALGALTFHPAESFALRPLEQESLDVGALARDASRIVEGDVEVAIPEIYRIGSSAGGMRPKAVVLYNDSLRQVRSGFAQPSPGDVPCLLKFDGVGDKLTEERLGEPQPFNRVEAAYAQIARAAGLDVCDMELLDSGDGRAHLLIRRFDIQNGERIHQHSLGGILHVDYNDVGASSYEEYLRTILRLGMPPQAVEQGYRRMAFNVIAVNQDDHVKNLSFHMGRDGGWRLTPAYDLTFAKGAGWTATHQMRVSDKLRDINRNDLLRVAATFGIKSPGHILDEIGAAVAAWPERAREVGVNEETIRMIEKELRDRWVAVGA